MPGSVTIAEQIKVNRPHPLIFRSHRGIQKGIRQLPRRLCKHMARVCYGSEESSLPC